MPSQVGQMQRSIVLIWITINDGKEEGQSFETKKIPVTDSLHVLLLLMNRCLCNAFLFRPGTYLDCRYLKYVERIHEKLVHAPTKSL